MNKVYGIVLILTGSFCGIALIGQLNLIMQNILELFNVNLNGNERGQVIGALTFYIVLIAVTFFALKHGLRFIKKRKKIISN